MATIFDQVLQPYDPIGDFQKWQNLSNSQLAGQGQQIANDTNQTSLQQQKYANLQRLIAGHLADPTASKGDVIDSINRGLKLGLYTPQQANQAMLRVNGLDDNPAAVHQHLVQGLASLLDAQQALQNQVPGEGPQINQGTTTTFTQRDPLFSASPGQIRPVITAPQGLSPSELSATGDVTVPVPTNRKDANGQLVLGPDGRPEVSVQTMPMTKARQLGLVDPQLGTQMATPPPPTFLPSNRLGSPAPSPAPSSSGAVPMSSSGVNTFAPPPVRMQGNPYVPVGRSGGVAPPGSAAERAAQEAWAHGGTGTFSGSPAPGVVQPQTSVSPAQNNPLARPTNQDALVSAGTQAKAANDIKYSSDEYKNNIQGGYSALNVLDSPDIKTGTGQQRISAALGLMTRLGIPINQNLATANDQLAHSLAQMLPGGGTDAGRIVAGLASGSPETSIEALKGLVRANMANRLSGQYAHTMASKAQPQDYIDTLNKTSRGIDQKVIVAHLINDPAQRSQYVAGLTQGMTAADRLAFIKDFKEKYNGLDHSALGIPSGTPAPLPR